jgi:phage-related baseplate assembly protein
VTSIDVQDAVNKENNANLWARITVEAREFVKQQILATLSFEQKQNKALVHKVADLATEV